MDFSPSFSSDTESYDSRGNPEHSITPGEPVDWWSVWRIRACIRYGLSKLSPTEDSRRVGDDAVEEFELVVLGDEFGRTVVSLFMTSALPASSSGVRSNGASELPSSGSNETTPSSMSVFSPQSAGFTRGSLTSLVESPGVDEASALALTVPA